MSDRLGLRVQLRLGGASCHLTYPTQVVKDKMDYAIGSLYYSPHLCFPLSFPLPLLPLHFHSPTPSHRAAFIRLDSIHLEYFF